MDFTEYEKATEVYQVYEIAKRERKSARRDFYNLIARKIGQDDRYKYTLDQKSTIQNIVENCSKRDLKHRQIYKTDWMCLNNECEAFNFTAESDEIHIIMCWPFNHGIFFVYIKIVNVFQRRQAQDHRQVPLTTYFETHDLSHSSNFLSSNIVINLLVPSLQHSSSISVWQSLWNILSRHCHLLDWRWTQFCVNQINASSCKIFVFEKARANLKGTLMREISAPFHSVKRLRHKISAIFFERTFWRQVETICENTLTIS